MPTAPHRALGGDQKAPLIVLQHQETEAIHVGARKESTEPRRVQDVITSYNRRLRQIGATRYLSGEPSSVSAERMPRWQRQSVSLMSVDQSCQPQSAFCVIDPKTYSDLLG
ncbi:hypothetical protein NDU88_002586 [Pleurodeles waltl]|uniref:Uncharacterized protein n=1 Tax=Pleurodeles waltl TaxID=8319 RepID=A0AAV7TL21_PLEWA|nr:hypothetical protein NDU88_002586 [Pleurodeles waltl]